MNNEYYIKQSDYVEFKKLDFSQIKNFSEVEKRIIEIAIQKFSSGKDVSIPHPIAEKLFQIIVDSPDIEQATNEVYLREVSKTPAVSKEKLHTVNEANRVMWKLLGNSKAVDGKEEIIISGQILADGRGDWAAIRNMHKILSKKFPDRPIRVIANSDAKWENKLDLSNIDESRLHLVYTKDMGGDGENVPLDAFKGIDILKKAEDASILISAGVGMNSIFESTWDQLKAKSIKMFEHDMHSLSKADKVVFFDPLLMEADKYNKYESVGDALVYAGLMPEDNRMGVFTKSYTEDFKWKDISSPNLLTALFDATSLDKKLIKSYDSSHECFFGYLNNNYLKYTFIQDVVKFSKENSPNKIIDICIPGSSTLLGPKVTREIWLARTKRDLIASLENSNGHDVGKVHLVWFEGGEKKEHTIVLDKNVKEGAKREIRIIDPGVISNRDFKIMTNISGPIIACTGDNSLAQALSYGKIPYYEQRFQTKWTALVSQIRNVLGEDSALYKYCLAGTPGPTERSDLYDPQLNPEVYDNVLKKGLVEEAKQFGRYIRAESNLKPVLNGVVNEKILRQKDLEFAKQQDVLRQKYLDNSISENELQIQFKALLNEKGL